MDVEYFKIDNNVVEMVNKVKVGEYRVCVVGMISMWVIELVVFVENMFKEVEGWINLFIYLFYEFSILDVMVINFYLFKFSLMIMVCVFGGYDLIMEVYKQVVKEKYWFFVYGDVMFIIQYNYQKYCVYYLYNKVYLKIFQICFLFCIFYGVVFIGMFIFGLNS